MSAESASPHGQEPPPGFVEHERKSPLTGPWEPIYAKITPAAFCLGLHVREAHCNSRGFAHGGMISALADNAMGLSAGLMARQAGGEGSANVRAVTVSLALDFVDSAQIGDWLEIRPVVLKAGRSLAFTEAHAVALREGRERVIARCNATFRLV